jgi:phage terminase large subunit-like protein
MKAAYDPRVILIEDNGPALELQEQFETSRCPVILVKPRGDKLSRLRRHLDLFRNGQVVLGAGAPFNNELITEFEGFAYGIHDDQVDTATQFFDYIRSNDLPSIPRRPPTVAAVSSVRKARENLYWNAGRPSGPYVFSRR